MLQLYVCDVYSKTCQCILLKRKHYRTQKAKQSWERFLELNGERGDPCDTQCHLCRSARKPLSKQDDFGIDTILSVISHTSTGLGVTVAERKAANEFMGNWQGLQLSRLCLHTGCLTCQPQRLTKLSFYISFKEEVDYMGLCAIEGIETHLDQGHQLVLVQVISCLQSLHP